MIGGTLPPDGLSGFRGLRMWTSFPSSVTLP
jgi:hypothetical protein